MATLRGTLGQVAPVANILTEIYTVPTLKSTVCRVIITETAGVPATFRVAVGVNGEADDIKQYIAYDRPMELNDTGSTVAFIIGAGDVVRVRSTTGTLSFSLTGIERDE